MTNDKTHKHSKYSLEFKQDAVRLVLEKGYSSNKPPIIWVYRAKEPGPCCAIVP
jgi:hypothetical protein